MCTDGPSLELEVGKEQRERERWSPVGCTGCPYLVLHGRCRRAKTQGRQALDCLIPPLPSDRPGLAPPVPGNWHSLFLCLGVLPCVLGLSQVKPNDPRDRAVAGRLTSKAVALYHLQGWGAGVLRPWGCHNVDNDCRQGQGGFRAEAGPAPSHILSGL